MRSKRADRARRVVCQSAARAAVEGLEQRRLLSSSPIISEFLAVNTSGIADEDGERGDWIELSNPTGAAVNLDGYFLTDDTGDLTKWRLPAVTLPAGGFKVVFADSKNRVNPAGTLHTNFSLASEGEYLALVSPNGTTVLSDYNFPAQVADVSYGVTVAQTTTSLIAAGTTARSHVPLDGSLGSTWTDPAFNDSSWIGGTTGVGYDTTPATAATGGFLVRMVDTGGGSDGQINTIGEATAVLDGTVAVGAFTVTSDTQVNRSTVNFGGNGGAFGGDQVFPNGVSPSTFYFNSSREQFAMRATADVTIPAGTWSIDVNSDDGMRLRIPGVTFTRKTGENFTSVSNPSPADTIVHGGTRGMGHTRGTFTVPAGGISTQIQLDYFDFNSTDGLELSIASGDQTSFSTSTFSLLGDNVRGWAVKQPLTNAFFVRMVDTAGGNDGNIDNIGEATAILDGTASPSAFVIASDTTGSRPVINLGSGGAFGSDLLLPNGLGPNDSTAAAGRDQYALRATAEVVIPAGDWTINVNSDDGFRLTLPGVTFLSRTNDDATGAVSPSPSDVLVYGGTRGPGDTFATFTVPAGGLRTTLQLDFFEQGGGDEVELSISSGFRTSFSTGTFSLLEHGVFGWSVTDPTTIPAPSFNSLLGADIRAQMQNVRSSAYVRVPFGEAHPGDFDALKLRMKYDDGYVAYLNGVEVARRNAGSTVTWASSALSDRASADALVFEDLILPDSARNLLRADSNVLAIHGLNDTIGSNNFLIYPELLGLRTAEQAGYFATPTPGASNTGSQSLGVAADTKFSKDRGFYTSAFGLTITSATSGAEIRYTLNGTAPTATTGTVYTGPFTISSTATVRAAAFKAGFTPSDVDTQTYLFVNDVVGQSPTGAAPAGWPSSWGQNTVDYGMDPDVVNNPTYSGTIRNDLQALPSISIVMKLDDLFNSSTGIYANPSGDERAWERPASVELIYPDGTKGFQVNAGIRIRGGFSRSTQNPKHAFRLFFRDEYGDSSLNYPIVGPTGARKFNKIDLRTFQNYSWSFQGDGQFTGLRDQFSRDTQLAMGQPAERGDYYNLYIDGQYWGIYNTDERISADYGASYFGGSKDDYDVVKVDPDLSYQVEATDGNLNAWNELFDLASAGFSSEAAYQRVLGNNPDGTRNSAYKVLVDPDNLIDYMLVIYYGGNKDAAISAFLGNAKPNNFYALRNRNGQEGWKFFAHDSEHTLLLGDLNIDRTGPWSGGNQRQYFNPQWLFQQLTSNPNFRIRVADRAQKAFFNDGALTPTSIAGRLQNRINQLDRAVVGESARWGDSKRGAPFTRSDWLAEINRLMNTYVPQRSGIVLNQLKNKGWYPLLSAPIYSSRGGVVSPGFSLSISNPSGGGAVYYTLDGSDPRQSDGSISPSAAAYTGPITISDSVLVRSRVKDGATWSAAEEATFSLDAGALRVTEMLYHPASPPSGSPYVKDDFEFLEVANTGGGPLDLTGLRFGAGITFNFPSTSLGAGQRAVIVKNTAAFQSRYGTSIPILGAFGGQLDNAGERILIETAAAQPVVDFTYSDEWYPQTDGTGYSLVAIDPNNVAALSTAGGWRVSQAINGGPGAVDPGVNPGAVVINEILTRTGGEDGDYIELYNPTSVAVDVSGWFLSDSAVDLGKYQIPTGTTIGAGGYLVFTQAGHFGVDGLPGVVTPFDLSGSGGGVYLTGADGAGGLGGYRESETYNAADPEAAFGRYVDSAGRAGFPAQSAQTPGAANAGPRLDAVVINELMYNPASGAAEYIELRNLTNTIVPLYDPANSQNTWQFTAGVAYALPAGAAIDPFGYALVVPIDPAAFRAQYSIPANVPVYGPYSTDVGNVLDNGGERVTLSRPLAPEAGGIVPYVDVDSVKYDDEGDWPTAPDGTGPSLSRLVGAAYGDDPGNWAAESPAGSPGRLNFDTGAASVLGVTINDGHIQRSMINSVTVLFDRVVTLDSGAILLTPRDGSALTPSLSTTDNRTYVLQFPGLTGGSLADGVYDLSVIASKVHAGGASGPVMAANFANKFHRLFSDADGDGDSDNFDLFQVRTSYLKAPTDPAFKGYFDYDRNGGVDNGDIFQIRSRRTRTYKGY